jgi:RNA polymerase sigma-70 factor (ECF subfamily)
VSVDEQVTLFLHRSLPEFSEQKQTGIPAKLIDASPCGVRVRHTQTGLQTSMSALVHSATKVVPVRAIWTTRLGPFLETGFLTEEAFLLGRLQAGETETLLPLLKPHLPQIKSAIRSIVRDATDAEDALQECLLKVIAHANQFHRGQSFKAWVLQIATHEALKAIQRNKRRLQFTVQIADGEGSGRDTDFIDPRGSPADELEFKELEAEFLSALGSLGDIYKRVFILRQIHELSMAEVAAELDIKVDTANTRLHRARMCLYRQLQEICRKGSPTKCRSLLVSSRNGRRGLLTRVWLATE